MSGETPVTKLASSIGALAILAWFAFLGPLGALILYGVAYSMLCENREMTTFLIGLTSIPVSLTVLWGAISGMYLSDTIWNKSSLKDAGRAKYRI